MYVCCRSSSNQIQVSDYIFFWESLLTWEPFTSEVIQKEIFLLLHIMYSSKHENCLSDHYTVYINVEKGDPTHMLQAWKYNWYIIFRGKLTMTVNDAC